MQVLRSRENPALLRQCQLGPAIGSSYAFACLFRQPARGPIVTPVIIQMARSTLLSNCRCYDEDASRLLQRFGSQCSSASTTSEPQTSSLLRGNVDMRMNNSVLIGNTGRTPADIERLSTRAYILCRQPDTTRLPCARFQYQALVVCRWSL